MSAVIPFTGNDKLGATEVDVTDGFGQKLPMRISLTNVDFDAASIAGVPVLSAAPAVADITDLDASAAELNVLEGITATTEELNLLTGAGAAVASGTQAAHIADPSGAVTDQDDEARTAIAAILDALEAFGITATS